MIKQNVKKRLTQIICIILAAMMVVGLIVIILSGCSPQKQTDGGSSVSAVQTGEEDPSAQDFVVLRGGEAVCSVIRPGLTTQSVKDAAVAIRRGIEAVTGVLPVISDDYLEPGKEADSSAIEILVGKTNRPESDAGITYTNYAGFSIFVSGNKLVVLASDDVGYKGAAEWLSNKLYDYYVRESGELVLPADFSVSGSGNSMLSTLPIYNTSGKIESLWDCGDSCLMYIIKETSSAEFEAYAAPLAEAGFVSTAVNQIGDNLYRTYTTPDGKYVLNTVFTAYEKKTRLIIEPLSKTALPDYETEYTDTAGPVTLTQVGLEYLYDPSKHISNYQIGMLYIFRLRDGRFIVIDGGYNHNKNLSLFVSEMKKLAADPNNITIAAWIFTHSHGDHVGLFRSLANSSERSIFTVERFIFNFMSKEQYAKINEGYPAAVYSGIANFKGAKIIKAHPGQKFSFGGAEIEYYSTIELVAPQACDTGNTTSAVFSVTAEGQKIMFLGDSSNTMTDVLIKCYGNELKSDIVQVAHHGAPGGTVELYKRIDARVAFWPLGVWDYYNFGGHGRKNETWNAYLFSSQNMMEIILAGHSERTVTLPYEPTVKTFPPDTEPKE